MEQVLLTPSALLDFLLQIDELSDMDISVSETPDGNILVSLGNENGYSMYSIDCSQAEEVRVEDNTVEQVSDINEEAYEDLVESEDDLMPIDQPVEGGLIKEVIKTLAVGGLARLAGKAAKNYMNS